MATEKIQELADEYDIPTEVVEEYIEYMGFEADEVDSLNYYGSFKNESDFAEQLVDEGIITDLGRYLYMTETDMRILAGEEADNRVDNMDDEEVLDETGDSYTPEEIDDAREYLKSEYYDEIHDALEKDAVEYFVENFGYEEQDLAKQSIFRVDYDKLGDDLQYDYNYIEHDGMVYVFNNYKRGGMMAKGGKSKKLSRNEINRLREIERQIIDARKTIEEFEEDDSETTYDRFGNPSAPSWNQRVVSDNEEILEKLIEEKISILGYARGGMTYAYGGGLYNEISKLYKGYLEAVIFTEEENLGSYYTIHDFDAKTKKSTEEMLTRFYNENESAILESGLDLETIGNDIWYTRSGQGAGFFDHNLDDDVERKLINGAKKLGEYPSVEENKGKLSISKGRVFAHGGVTNHDLLEFTIPNWAISSLINGDDSGLEDEDIETIDKFVNKIVAKYGNANFMLPNEEEMDLGFRYSNDIDRMGSDCSLLYLLPTKGYDDGDSTDEENYAKGGNVPTIEKRVAEVNALIKEGNEKGVKVIDESTTWQAPMKYNLLKYSNGVLYVSFKKLDLYKHNKGMGTKYENENYRIGKSGMGLDDQRATLTDIARMYRKAINSFNKYGYADGGETDSNTYEKVKVTIRDVDMGGDVIYKYDHWFRKDQLSKKSNQEIGEYILRKYGLDYGNTYKYSIVRTDETKQKMAKGGMTRGDIENEQKGLQLRIAKIKKQISAYENQRGKYNKLFEEKVVPLQNRLLELSELWGKAKYSDGGIMARGGGLNYVTKNGINFDIAQNGKTAIVIAKIEDEDNYMLDKSDLREMSESARTKGIDRVELHTNYGLELRSNENPKIVGFDSIKKKSYADGGEMAKGGMTTTPDSKIKNFLLEKLIDDNINFRDENYPYSKDEKLTQIAKKYGYKKHENFAKSLGWIMYYDLQKDFFGKYGYDTYKSGAKDFMAKGGITIYNLKKGDKVKTRKGDIETIERKIDSGYYTIESEYSHPFESLEFVSRPRKMEDGGIMAKGGMTNHGLKNGDKIVGSRVIGTTIVVRNERLDEDARIDLNMGKRTIIKKKSKSEAIKNAKRIADTMRKKEMAKKKV